MSQYPSIFNDVLGPVMRGASSSHCAAALRIGLMALDLMQGKIDEVLVEFDPNGSLKTTHASHGSDMGLFSGFLGYEAHDDRLKDYKEKIKEAGIKIDIKIVPLKIEHPNVYQLSLKNAEISHRLTAISIGGGMIEVMKIDGTAVSMVGDYNETIIFTKSGNVVISFLEKECEVDSIVFCEGENPLVQVKSQLPLPDALFEKLQKLEEVTAVRRISAVLPVRSRSGMIVPFTSCDEMLAYNKDKDLQLWELALRYEAARGGISEDEVMAKMVNLVGIMSNSIQVGLKGTSYKDRILGCQSKGFKENMDKNTLVESNALNQIILYVTAMMEVKSSMGVIVAAPTAGACGALPGALLGATSAMGLSEKDDTVKAMLAAGMIGVFIAFGPGFAAEVGGCQAECGSGSGMAAAGIVMLAGGGLDMALGAASMALQNSLGMVCDPIANRVEAPCLGRNTMAASNALTCANMALSSFEHLVPLDQVIKVMEEVGEAMHRNLRCTGLGGLSQTEASLAIESRFKIC
jgi:L-serine dehydratase